MKYTLQFRLILSFTLVILLTVGAVFFVMWQAATIQIQKYNERVEHMVSGRIHFVIGDYYINNNMSWDGILPVISKLAEQFNYRIILADTDGKIIADSENGTSGTRLDLNKFSSRLITLPNEPQKSAPVRPRENMSLPAPTLIFSGQAFPGPPPEPPLPDLSQSQVVGYLFLTPLTQSPVGLTALQILTSEMGRYFMAGACLAVAVAIILTIFLSRRILAPVKSLTLAAQRLGKGDFSQRVNIKEKSEIGELATTFNRMAADLERDEKLRRDLVADIAHELRSPLTNVRGYLEAIRDGIIVPDEHTVNTIYDETMLLSRLIEDLQELSLAESGQLKLYCQNEDIGNIITQAITAVMAKASIKDIKLSVELPGGLPAVFIDRQRIKQVLLNLLTNALTHTPSGRSITVSAEQVGDHIAVCVADNGEGIPPDELPFIFERFHRVDKSRTRLTGGSGLGLTIARYFVEAHKGTITAWSEPGKGSRFTFTLPAVGA